MEEKASRLFFDNSFMHLVFGFYNSLISVLPKKGAKRGLYFLFPENMAILLPIFKSEWLTFVCSSIPEILI